MTGMNQPHVDPPTIPLSKEKIYGESDKNFVKLKLPRYPTLSTSDLYEFKMSLFENVKLEDVLLFICNVNMTLAASGMLEADSKFQYLCTIVRGEAFIQFDLLSADVESTENLNVDYIIKGFAQYTPPVDFLSKQKCTMRLGM